MYLTIIKINITFDSLYNLDGEKASILSLKGMLAFLHFTEGVLSRRPDCFLNHLI